MIGFILSLVGIAALTFIAFAIGAGIGVYISCEALAANDKAEMKRLCDIIQEYWNKQKNSSTLG